MDINKNRIAGKQYLNIITAPNTNFGRKRFFRKNVASLLLLKATANFVA